MLHVPSLVQPPTREHPLTHAAGGRGHGGRGGRSTREGTREHATRHGEHAQFRNARRMPRVQLRVVRSLARSPRHPDSNMRKPLSESSRSRRAAGRSDPVAARRRRGGPPNSTARESKRGRGRESPRGSRNSVVNGIREARRRRTSLIPAIAIKTPRAPLVLGARLRPSPDTPSALIGPRRNWIAGPVAQSRVDDFSRNR